MLETNSYSRRAIRILVRHCPAVLLAAAWPYLLLVSLFILARIIIRPMFPPDVAYDPVATWQEMLIAAKLGILIAFVATAFIPRGLAMAGVTLLAYRASIGSESSLWTTLTLIKGRLLPLVTLSFLLGCATVLGWSTIVFGIFVEILTVFAVPVLLLEGCGMTTAVRRSILLAWQRIGTVVSLVVSAAIAVIVMEVLGMSLVGSSDLGDATLAAILCVSIVVIAPLIVCVYGTFVAVLYRDLVTTMISCR